MSNLQLRIFDETNTTQLDAIDASEDWVDDVHAQYDAQFEYGSGRFSLPLDHDVAGITGGHVVRVYLNYGTEESPSWAPWFAWRIDAIEPVPVEVGKDDGQRVMVSGRGLLADWGEVICVPDLPLTTKPKPDARVFFFGSPDYDRSGWGTPHSLGQSGWLSPFYAGYPNGWRDAPAEWVWHPAGDLEDAPAGYCFFVWPLTFGAEVADVWFGWTADNTSDAWFDGRHLGTSDDFREHQTASLGTVSAGTHYLAIAAANSPDDGPPGGNPAGVLWTMTEEGAEGAVLFHSEATGDLLGYPEEWPWVTVGQAMLLLADDMPYVGRWTFTFDADEDSDGVPWQHLQRIEARIHEKLDGVLKGFGDVWCDFRVAPTGLQLDAFVKGTLGQVADLELVTAESTAGQADPDAVNVAGLEWEGIRDGYEAILVEWDGAEGEGGFLVRPDSPPTTARWESITVAAATEEEATEIGDAYLDAYGTGTLTATLTLTRGVPLPGSSWNVWDIFEVPSYADPDETIQQRVRSVTVTVGDDGDAVVTVELGSLRLEQREWLDRRVARMTAPGAAGGRGQVATPPAKRFATTHSPGSAWLPAFDQPQAVSGDTPYPYVWHSPQPARATAIRLEASPGTGLSEVTIGHEGTTVATFNVDTSISPQTMVVEDVDVVTDHVKEWTYERAGGDHGIKVWIGHAFVSLG